jgi:hypothetical protein
MRQVAATRIPLLDQEVPREIKLDEDRLVLSPTDPVASASVLNHAFEDLRRPTRSDVESMLSTEFDALLQ